MTLIETAPTEFAVGIVYGKMAILQSITALTGRQLAEDNSTSRRFIGDSGDDFASSFERFGYQTSGFQPLI